MVRQSIVMLTGRNSQAQRPPGVVPDAAGGWHGALVSGRGDAVRPGLTSTPVT